MSRQVKTRGGAMPKTDARVSAFGVHVSRFRHWCREHREALEIAVTLPLLIGTIVVLMWGGLALFIGAMPINR